MGPTSDFSSNPSPTTKPDIISIILSVNSSATDSWTIKRFAAMHTSPILRILAPLAPMMAWSRSASSKTMKGALPPSSIEVRNTCLAALPSRFAPTPVDPVKDNLRSRGSSRMASVTA